MPSIVIDSIFAGCCIGIGGTVYLLCPNQIVGSFLFATGLFVICTYGLKLFTGKVNILSVHIINNDVAHLGDTILYLLKILFGNFVGVHLTRVLLSYTRYYNQLQEKAKIICDVKTNDNLISLFILAIGCGALMHIAVNTYKTNMYGVLAIFLCVSVFILCGFEHIIADLFYFSLANAWSVNGWLRLLVICIGNVIGGNLYGLRYNYADKTY